MSNTNEQDLPWKPTREQLLDVSGRPLTQSLFLETQYGSDAIYTLKEVDHVWNDKVYYSLKRLYLEMGDPTEYQFATTYFLGWKHWQRICDNKLLSKHIEQCRFELEMKLRSEGVRQSINQARSGSWQAAKWMSEAGWVHRPAGRPSKEEMEKHKAIEANLQDEFADDIKRLKLVK